MQSPFNQNEQQFITEVKKSIQNTLSNIFDDFPKDLASFIKSYCILTGGMSASFFVGEKPKDYDFYFKDERSIDIFKNAINANKKFMDLVEDCKENYIQTLVDGKLITANAITFKNKIQIITMATADVRKAFDFIHCMPYYDCDDSTYHISKAQFDSIRNKQLVVNPNYVKVNPQAHENRIIKYKTRGWKL